MGQRRKLGLLGGFACALAAGSVLAYAAAEDGPDHLTASVHAVNSGNVTILAPTGFGTVTVTCTVSMTGGLIGTTLSTGINPVKFSDASGAPCTDNASASPCPCTDTFSSSGAWSVAEVDAANDEGLAEPNATGDSLRITIPKAGLVDHNSQSSSCKITVAPSAAATISGSYNDAGTLTITNATVPVSYSGCFVSGSSVEITVKYSLSPPIFDAG